MLKKILRILLGLTVIAVLAVGAVLADRKLEQEQPPQTAPTSPGGELTRGPEEDGTQDLARPWKVAHSGTLELLPGIAQPGVEAVGTRDTVVLKSHFDPAQKGAVVQLQRRTGAGWVNVTRTQQDGQGRARFVVPGGDADERFHYRAAVLDRQGKVDARTPAVYAGEWLEVFRDDFNVLNPAVWSTRQPGLYNPAGSRTCSKSDPRAASVARGVLNLKVMRDPNRVDERCVTEHGTFGYFLNGHISTEYSFDFTRGVAAARVKFPRDRGQHGAFWLQRNATIIPGNPAASGAEIDVVEFFGEGYPRGGLTSFVYFTGADGESIKAGRLLPQATEQLPPGDDWWKQYHVFSVEWTPDEYIFRVDGRTTFRTSRGVSGIDQFLILSLLSSDWELPQLDESELPSTMKVDWVRVWQPN